MKNTFVAAFVCWVFFSFGAPLYTICQSGKPIKMTFPAFLKAYQEERLKLNPLEATYAGDHRYDDQLPNFLSEAYMVKEKAFYTSYKGKLAEYDRDALSEEEKTSYDVLMWECDINLDRIELDKGLLPIDQFSALHLIIGQLASGESAQPFETAKDYDNWKMRVLQFLKWCDAAVGKMKTGMKQGVTLPKALAKKTIPQLRSMASEPVEENIFYKPIKKLAASGTVSEEDKKRLKTVYSEMIKNDVIPTLRRLHEFMEQEYLPACRETAGVWALPNGKQLYDHKIKEYTTTTMTADEIFELGKSEVKRIKAEMERVKDEVGFKGDLKSFFDHVRNKKELMPFKKPEEVIASFYATHDRMKPYLEKMFDLTPKTKFEVRRTEAFREASASAEYFPGSLDGSRPGIFYVPIPDVTKYNNFADDDLFLHEAIPGHHYQISLQQENQDLPDFRKTLWYSAYGEGWGLYSESLGKELGLYRDPYQYFGMLSMEMHRAIRLVVDAGMHAKKWTREQAIAYSLENEAESEASVIAEIERYMSLPGQALSYKIGQLKIIELRKRAEQELGEDFDIREFHNQVLQRGNIPLALLEQKIDAWISAEKSR